MRTMHLRFTWACLLCADSRSFVREMQSSWSFFKNAKYVHTYRCTSAATAEQQDSTKKSLRYTKVRTQRSACVLFADDAVGIAHHDL